MQCFFSGGREQLVENTGRELPSQHRTVGDNAIGVVDKRYAVNPSYGVDPENSEIIRKSLPQGAKIQLVIGDGLSSAAILANAMDCARAIDQGLKTYGVDLDPI